MTERSTVSGRVDVAVVGLGTAGATVAALLAEGGMRVLALDRGPLAEAGARWVNGVPAWMFREAGVALPSGAELRGGGQPFHLVCGMGPSRVVLHDSGVLEVDMRHLVARLQSRATAAGAQLRGGVRVTGLSGTSLQTSEGEIEATTVIDASGLGGAGLLPRSAPGAKHLCVAAQGVYEVADQDAGRDYMERHGVRPGDTLCFTGIEGGYSILNVRLHGGEVSVLTGSIPGLGHASGREILERFVNEEPWVGSRRFGGSRAIPLSRPVDQLVHQNVALLGDAARQVFTVHGSGIGLGMIAAKTLAETLCAGEPLQRYRARWMRSYGALQATYEVFRRFSASLTEDEIRALVDAGLMNARSAGPTLQQRWPAVDPLAWAQSAVGAVRVPRLAARLARVGLDMAFVRALYARHPEEAREVEDWARRVERRLPL